MTRTETSSASAQKPPCLLRYSPDPENSAGLSMHISSGPSRPSSFRHSPHMARLWPLLPDCTQPWLSWSGMGWQEAACKDNQGTLLSHLQQSWPRLPATQAACSCESILAGPLGFPGWGAGDFPGERVAPAMGKKSKPHSGDQETPLCRRVSPVGVGVWARDLLSGSGNVCASNTCCAIWGLELSCIRAGRNLTELNLALCYAVLNCSLIVSRQCIIR